MGKAISYAGYHTAKTPLFTEIQVFYRFQAPIFFSDKGTPKSLEGMDELLNFTDRGYFSTSIHFDASFIAV